jgi:hypothetical protein
MYADAYEFADADAYVYHDADGFADAYGFADADGFADDEALLMMCFPLYIYINIFLQKIDLNISHCIIVS